MAGLRQYVKQILINKQHRVYKKEVHARNLSYDRWISIKERELGIAESIFSQKERSLTNDFLRRAFESKRKENAGNHSVCDELCRQFENEGQRVTVFAPSIISLQETEGFLNNLETDVILIAFCDGKVSDIALELILKKFEENKNIILIYGDEDIQQCEDKQEEERTEPWFKPDWSPDRFLSCFYFGGLVAVRAKEFKEAFERCIMGKVLKEDADTPNSLYRVLFEMIRLHGGFEKRQEETGGFVYHIRQVLFHDRKNSYEQLEALMLSPEVERKLCEAKGQKNVQEAGDNKPLLSIIIPSKDNPGVLFLCIRSLLERTVTDYSYEILVVDNGSNEENRQNIVAGLKSMHGHGGFQGCRYIYQPMVFNFSRMCNLGAQEAKGSLLLFLNDDMEIIQPDWMKLMIEKALLPYVGCVGAKLLYPASDIIQHAGITNLRVGPAHKLQFLRDDQVHYYGMNRGVHNMLGATGACLMMRRDVFEEAGGFCEELAVAFNDVDLCYTIYENGYYNVVRNDVVLYHHESLSRGKDGESEEKQLRLLGEKDVLYERHQDIYGKDPFYHPYLTTDMLESEYSPAYRYEVTLSMPWAAATLCTQEVQSAREDKCLVIGMECAMDIYKWRYGVTPDKGKIKVKPEEMGYYFQGYTFVIGADNACYKNKLLLKNKETGEIFGITIDKRYRQDIRNNLKDQLNVDLTGYATKVQKGLLPPGIYQFGMLAADQCSRQKLVNWSNWILEVTVDE